ncbi:M2 family metallopeptidase [Tuwongella immobilis]|uniref:Peptidase M3A/M3B catalytic domain-containing protein n=1 Tax=Tuwongella immobilis TaxID=692036 RepID=A0A6C2YRQ0_9BACT|nr:M2 family metallopeptidase [Tuwongella immobilis]VIP04037.1 peptidase m3a and m3b thimet oligopeptidase f : Oligoendopeptidase F OS=Singulisphaera acidiphila (strain ATCC BAA-1392 / DSM 18658 / VKM B-2454 / MOB10) GN=Sinac_2369 PE=3 SV=1: Peptidase_M3: Peptidase_M3 [Tuwongella immobilis]VTS05441.1 peptidase m3a and m3b thimet oligopeptidase f : Oligoendopeptidase F OS=Singulisphaera acidiphila (strain ATCC BAA-1392 / DSM 18658 / VKM B-2454 / MOB10) GN=Sinac_2369 PE=3 SV=1: Peptidase_M3: Peptid
MLTRREFFPKLGSLACVTMVSWTGTSQASPEMTDKAKKFIAAHEARIRPLEIANGLAWWNANTSGKDEDFAKKEAAQNKVDAALANADAFAELKALKQARQSGQIDDPLIARCIDVLYLQYLEKQVEPELLKKIVAKANAVEQKFNVYRAKVDGKELADSEVRNILKSSTDPERRKAVWESSKGVGASVEADLKELVKLRNQAAKQLGYANFHALMLDLNEQDGPSLIQLFDDLDKLTKEPFAAAKAEIDAKLAAAQGVKVEDLRPWSYHDPFFQESPAVFDVSLDAPYQKADLLKLCQDFYRGIGLPIERVIARSDLYEKPGKSPHAFCTDIDREGDVRVLANIVPNEYWAGTMLHELGHAVYSSLNIPASLPYVVRGEAHILSTEGVAMQFERFSKSRAWLETMGVTVPDADKFEAAAKKVQRNQLLIFSRWCQVMLRFEKAMYENPDQDLNKLWWDLVEQYQQVKRPEGRNAPDYASKIHICSAPVYYHNYMMGQLFASQVHHTIAKELYNGADPSTVIYIGNPAVGQFMKDRVFAPGRTRDWRGLTRFATGKDLSPEAFARDFQGK